MSKSAPTPISSAVTLLGIDRSLPIESNGFQFERGISLLFRFTPASYEDTTAVVGLAHFTATQPSDLAPDATGVNTILKLHHADNGGRRKAATVTMYYNEEKREFLIGRIAFASANPGPYGVTSIEWRNDLIDPKRGTYVATFERVVGTRSERDLDTLLLKYSHAPGSDETMERIAKTISNPRATFAAGMRRAESDDIRGLGEAIATSKMLRNVAAQMEALKASKVSKGT